MSRLSLITQEIKSLLEGITEAEGYTFNFGSINEADQAKVVYPCADITYVKESTSSNTQASWGYAEVEYKIVIKDQLSTSGTNSSHDIDENYNNILYAIKKQLSINICALRDTYQGFEKEYGKTGDIHTPTSLIINIKVQYQYEE